jgi:hypothetical protein
MAGVDPAGERLCLMAETHTTADASGFMTPVLVKSFRYRLPILRSPLVGSRTRPPVLAWSSTLGRAGEREQLGPGQQFAGELDDLTPDLILREPVQG